VDLKLFKNVQNNRSTGVLTNTSGSREAAPERFGSCTADLDHALKKPKDLDHALRIALQAEANTVERVIVETVEAPAKNKEYKARSA